MISLSIKQPKIKPIVSLWTHEIQVKASLQGSSIKSINFDKSVIENE